MSDNNKVTDRILREIEQNNEAIKRRSEDNTNLLAVKPLFDGVDLSDVRYLSASVGYLGDLRVSLTLDSEHRDSKLAHVLARKLHLKFTKEKSYWDESLNLSAVVPATDTRPEVTITINGSAPATCRIEVEEIPLTPEELLEAQGAAIAKVSTVRTTRKIVCTEEVASA